ncbi:MAG: EAL domain-containing protein [Xanthobacteraceae bacterium]|nr:EAL domain-containing protein [Xanthobacteraceae bacterium]
MKKVLVPFRLDLSNESLMQAQVASYTNQVPLLYFVLCVNAVSVAFTHHGVAPAVLTELVPACFVVLSVARFGAWMRIRKRKVTDAMAAARLKHAVLFSFGVGALFLGWALSLYYFGNAATRSHLNLAVGITGVGCLFCLMHLRVIALILAAVVVFPYAAFLVLTQDAVSVAIGFNLFLITCAMLYILLVVSRNFERLVESQAEAERLSRENFRLANIDSLTGLPNRRKFFADLDDLLDRAEPQGQRFAVGLIDLDGFKSVNDLYGHNAGDRLLVAVGERLEAFASDRVAVARLGGDEFGLLLRDFAEEGDVLELAERICAVLRAPFEGFGAAVNVSGSAGFALFPQAGTTREQLFERADYAMYHGKQGSRGYPVIFDPSHAAEIRSNSVIERCLRNADLEAELSVRFQPVFDTSRNRPIAFEALARWHSPELGDVPPGVFIGVAERSDLINRITPTLLRKALAAAKTWPDDIRVSFNLSIRDLLSSQSVVQIVAVVESSGFAPGRIDFEVTETAFIGDFGRAGEAIEILKALGARIALDDFGTGYSSLGYIHRLPLDEIKIDRSFVAGIEQQEGPGRTIIRTIVDLCRNLGVQCVVEGAETAAQVGILRELGCETMQGYYFARPMAEHEVAEFIAGAATDGGRAICAA